MHLNVAVWFNPGEWKFGANILGSFWEGFIYSQDGHQDKDVSFSVLECFLCMWWLELLQASGDHERNQSKATNQHNVKSRGDRRWEKTERLSCYWVAEWITLPQVLWERIMSLFFKLLLVGCSVIYSPKYFDRYVCWVK